MGAAKFGRRQIVELRVTLGQTASIPSLRRTRSSRRRERAQGVPTLRLRSRALYVFTPGVWEVSRRCLGGVWEVQVGGPGENRPHCTCSESVPDEDQTRSTRK